MCEEGKRERESTTPSSTLSEGSKRRRGKEETKRKQAYQPRVEPAQLHHTTGEVECRVLARARNHTPQTLVKRRRYERPIKNAQARSGSTPTPPGREKETKKKTEGNKERGLDWCTCPGGGSAFKGLSRFHNGVFTEGRRGTAPLALARRLPQAREKPCTRERART